MPGRINNIRSTSTSKMTELSAKSHSRSTYGKSLDPSRDSAMVETGTTETREACQTTPESDLGQATTPISLPRHSSQSPQDDP